MLGSGMWPDAIAGFFGGFGLAGRLVEEDAATAAGGGPGLVRHVGAGGAAGTAVFSSYLLLFTGLMVGSIPAHFCPTCFLCGLGCSGFAR